MLATEIDLQAWCHKEREPLSAPFVRGGFRYATDGQAMIRLPAPGEPDTDNPLIPDSSKIFDPAESLTFAPWPADWDPTWETWETTKIEGEKEECPDCHGETKECERCDGSGLLECGECGQDYDCPACKGKGHVGKKCATCGNRGTVTKLGRALRLAVGIWVDERYLRRLVSLPNLRWTGVVNRPVFFRFDGGEAAVMPVVGPAE
jgi:hypothetical protein